MLLFEGCMLSICGDSVIASEKYLRTFADVYIIISVPEKGFGDGRKEKYDGDAKGQGYWPIA